MYTKTDENNNSTSTEKTYHLDPNSVNFTVSSPTTSSLLLAWTKPGGNFSQYVVVLTPGREKAIDTFLLVDYNALFWMYIIQIVPIYFWIDLFLLQAAGTLIFLVK